jgi:hypothetical protein
MMRLIGYVLVIAALLIWIIIKKKRMSQEEKHLQAWLNEHGLIRYKQDHYNVASLLQKSAWIISLSSITQVIQVRYGAGHYHLFSADHQISERVYRTFGCTLISISQNNPFILFPAASNDLYGTRASLSMSRVYFSGKGHANELFIAYAEDPDKASRILSRLERILLDVASRDVVIEIHGGHMLLLQDEYFTVTDIENSMKLAPECISAFS